ncbi:DciA family protein [Streptomyces sp. NPDC056069]|uniref:DciA family protein n=1 Tax=Streptomyces sp. NPDC056069 TaxID=3345702 RepID=UPI0035E0BA78
MPDTPQLSGRDLARQALAAYKTGRRPGTGPGKPARRTARRSSDGRDPQTFAAILGRLGAEQNWAAGVQGGSILDRWTELCPQYEGRVQAVAYDAERRRLDVRPGSDAYATQLRLLGGQLCRQINDKLGDDAVRSIRVLPVGTLTTGPSQPERFTAVNLDPAPADAEAPVRTRDTASAGYHRALDAHREVYRSPATEGDFAALCAQAEARQVAALRARREDPEAHSEYVAQLELQQADQPHDDYDATIQAALRRARTGQTTGSREPRRIFGAA